MLLIPALAKADPAWDAAEVKTLDTRFQAATKANDVAAIDAALPEDYILITGSGRVVTKADLVRDARERTTIYELQDPSQQTVRLWGDTAVITALLRIKGVRDGTPIDFSVWYSDTYVRTPKGWRYVLGQAGQAIPPS
jgi:ketosteroid isomerase-like protein